MKSKFGVLLAFCLHAFLLSCICSICAVSAAISSPNIPVNWIQGMGDGISFSSMTTVGSTNEIVVVGTLNLTSAGGSPVMENVLNSEPFSGSSLMGFVSVMRSDGNPSWTRLLDFSPNTVTEWTDRLYVAGSKNNSSGSIHRFSLQGDVVGTTLEVPNTWFYGSSVDPATDLLYFTGTEMANDKSSVAVFLLDSGGSLTTFLSSSYGVGRNTGNNIVVRNNIVGLSLTVESLINLCGTTLNPSGESNFYAIIDLHNQAIYDLQHYGNKPHLVTAKLSGTFFGLSFDGTKFHQYSSGGIFPVSMFADTSAGSLEIYGLNGESAQFLVVTGKVTGSVPILGKTTIASSQFRVPDGFVCKIAYPIGSSVVCDLFGSDPLVSSGRLVSVDAVGNIIVAAQAGISQMG